MAGPVVTGAVILPPDFKSDLIKDSKKLSKKKRNEAYKIITENAITYSVQACSVKYINAHGINPATFLAMHKCLNELSIKPEHILVDGIVWNDWNQIPYSCVPKGDNTYLSIAAAAIIAKVRRDEYMQKLHDIHPNYDWSSNNGYGTKKHTDALLEHGATSYHRTQYIRNYV